MGTLVKKECCDHLSELFRLQARLHHKGRVVEEEAYDLPHLADDLAVAQAGCLDQGQIIILRHLDNVRHFGELLLALWRLLRKALRQNDGEEIRLVRAQGAADDRRVRPGRARRVDMISLLTDD